MVVVVPNVCSCTTHQPGFFQFKTQFKATQKRVCTDLWQLWYPVTKEKNIQCIDLTLLYLKIFIPYHPNTTIQLNKTIKTCMFWIIYVIRSVINNYNINVDLLWHDQSHYRSCNQEVTVKSSWSSTLSNSLASFANSTISKHIMKPCV